MQGRIDFISLMCWCEIRHYQTFVVKKGYARLIKTCNIIVYYSWYYVRCMEHMGVLPITIIGLPITHKYVGKVWLNMSIGHPIVKYFGYRSIVGKPITYVHRKCMIERIFFYCVSILILAIRCRIWKKMILRWAIFKILHIENIWDPTHNTWLLDQLNGSIWNFCPCKRSSRRSHYSGNDRRSLPE